MATLTMPAAFLQDVIEHRDDDAPRLIFADWLEEHGEQARAEFIRVQVETARLESAEGGQHADHPEAEKNCVLCARLSALRRRERGLLDEHGFDWFGQLVRIARLDRGRGPDRNAWHFRSVGGTLGWCLFRRGFPAEITCRLGDWCGGPCGECGGQGVLRLPRAPYPSRPCPACSGSRCTRGHGPALVRGTPLERVTLSDREPFCYTAADRPTYLWRCVTNGYGNERNLLPVALFDALPGHEHGHVAEYATRQEAESALSEACLAWAKAQPATS